MPRSDRTPRQEWPASGENRLLAALPPDEYAQVLAQTDLRSFQARDVLYRPGGRVEYVYFPRSGVVSAVFVMLDGRSAEVGAVGREGMLGVTAFLGADSYPTQAICQVSAEVLRMPAAAFLAEVRRGASSMTSSTGTPAYSSTTRSGWRRAIASTGSKGGAPAGC